jgi:ABC-2 type transport system permease protein
MEKLLGQNYKWWYLLVYNFKSSITYKWSTVINVFAGILAVSGVLLIWYVNIASGSQLANFDYIFTYYIIGNIFKTLSQNNFQGDLSREILNGRITRKMLTPGNLWIHYFGQGIGANLLSIIIEVLFLVLVGSLGFNFLIKPNFLGVILFLFIFIIIFFTQIFLSVIFGSLAFFMTDAFGIINFARSLETYTSGRLFPLNIIPQTVWLGFLPYSFTFHHPMQIYLDKYTNLETFYVFLGGIFWCAALYFLTKWVFKMGLKRNESVGL